MSESRIAVITGTRKGIGHFLANHYLGKGFTVIGCSRKPTKINHDRFRGFELDITDADAVASMFRALRKDYGGVDVLLNNAGIASMNHCITTPIASAQSIMSTNFLGSFLFTQHAARLMRKRGGGAIVNFTTVAVPLSLAGEAVYAASKSAVETFTRVSAKELSGMGIRVNNVGPTPISTDLIRGVPAAKLDELVNMQAIPRLGTFEDVANVVDFFISPESSFITGQTIYLGGITG